MQSQHSYILYFCVMLLCHSFQSSKPKFRVEQNVANLVIYWQGNHYLEQTKHLNQQQRSRLRCSSCSRNVYGYSNIVQLLFLLKTFQSYIARPLRGRIWNSKCRLSVPLHGYGTSTVPGISTCSSDRILRMKIGIQQRESVMTIEKNLLAMVTSFLMWLLYLVVWVPVLWML